MKTRLALARAPAVAVILALSGAAALTAGSHIPTLDERVMSGTSELSQVDWTASFEGARTLARMHYGNLPEQVRQGASELARAQWQPAPAEPVRLAARSTP
ncbi:hypothetical protein [Aquabacterium sp.]|uniref:hypothetical protein n=1 Tax=Aquabacterium sp. TaxID=1872578 RepID=UPI00378334E8